jgi:alpha-amylase
VTWTSSSAKVAGPAKGKARGQVSWTVGGKGRLAVKAYKTGKTKITLTAGKAKLVVTVKVVAKRKAVKATALRLSGSSQVRLRPKGAVRLKARVTPAAATKVVATWRSNKPKVAKVDAAGRVTAIARGKAVITLKAAGKTARKTVTVR